ncbi:MAG: phosphoglycolate phosphatase [Burkholderiales bacterium]
MSFPLRVSAVTIDLDGTLLDTIPDLAMASNMMLAELGFQQLDEARIRTFVGKGIPRLVERALEAALGEPPSDELKARALAVFERHYAAVNGKHTTIYAGVKEGLDLLRARDFPLACVTNKSERFTRPLLDAVGLSSYFEHVVAGDTLPQKKPHPAPLLHACSALNVTPGAMLMVGDSLNDAQAARAAGCPVFCVTYGYNEGQDVHDLDTDALVSSLAEAVELIEKA